MAPTFKAAIDDPARFSRSKTVGAHFGPAPRREQPGTSVDNDGRISRAGDGEVRTALRGRQCDDDALAEALHAEGIGAARGRQARAQAGRRGGRAQARCRHASHVAGWHRVPFLGAQRRSKRQAAGVTAAALAVA
ncbi:MAG TPA: transposase [Xanthobacteraceae bacterium]|nr:transposase [Xanthobacteraceae bacterium]